MQLRGPGWVGAVGTISPTCRNKVVRRERGEGQNFPRSHTESRSPGSTG